MQSNKIEQNRHIAVIFTYYEENNIYFVIIEILALDATIIYYAIGYRIANRCLRS
jgi:hypothetical protein